MVDGWSVKKYSTDDEEDVRTAREGTQLVEGCWIYWNEGDEIIKRMQAERMTTDEEVPSMWNYDPRCLPKEFVDMERETFVVDPTKTNLCFVEKEILVKICKHLMPLAFVRLSSTCRYLHWRLFAFTTCYAPYIVDVEIRDLKVGYYYQRGEAVTRLYENSDARKMYSLRLEKSVRRQYPMLSAEEGDRAVVARFPSFLRRPFRIKDLGIDIHLPFFTKMTLDQCLPLIQSVRPVVDRLTTIFFYNNLTNSDKFFDYTAINDFLKACKATSCGVHESPHENDRYLEIFARCPYVRTIDYIQITFDNNPDWEDIVLLNIGGDYDKPPVSTVIRTIDYWRQNDFGNLKYHLYSIWQDDEKTTLLLKYFLDNFGEYEEYHREYNERINERRVDKSYATLKCATMVASSGEKYAMKVDVYSGYHGKSVDFFFGKEKELEERYGHNWEMSSSDEWWKIETAVEPEVDEEDEKTTAREKEDDEATTHNSK